MEQILEDIKKERKRQLEKWGLQRHPDFSADAFSHISFPVTASGMRHLNDTREAKGLIAWDSILMEEIYEAMEEIGYADIIKLREELIQCGAVIVAWIEDLDSRKNEKS